MKLRTLPPRLKPASLTRLAPAPVALVERKRGSAGVRDRNAIRARDFGLCQACKAQGRVSLGAAVDHKVPLWAGGSDEPSNKWLLCTACHDSKSARESAQRAAGGLIR
jgi:5-methylcytosine-specific restriction protein A